jgi:dihydrofolate reductase
MKFFRETTTGHSVVMGRKTWDSMGGKPLKNRTNIIVSRQQLEILAIVKHDIVSALEYAKIYGDVYVIGGGEIYREAMPYADRLLITHVDTEISDPDTFFPEINIALWRENTILSNEDDEMSFRISEYFLVK